MKSRIAQIEDDLRAIGYADNDINKMKQIEIKYDLNLYSIDIIKNMRKTLQKKYKAKISAAEYIKSEIENFDLYIKEYARYKG